jgi:AbrB family looped-hinge helix DNA binding protein
VTAKGQITLRKEVLEHLGIRPGDRVEVELLPSGRMQIRPRPKNPVSSVFGLLQRPGTRPLSIEELGELADSAWAGER